MQFLPGTVKPDDSLCFAVMVGLVLRTVDVDAGTPAAAPGIIPYALGARLVVTHRGCVAHLFCPAGLAQVAWAVVGSVAIFVVNLIGQLAIHDSIDYPMD